MSAAVEAVVQHLERFFDGHATHRISGALGPVYTRVPSFEVLAIAPGPRLAQWTYVSLGCWDSVHSDRGHGYEFLLIAPELDERHPQTLAMTAYYNAGPDRQRLGLGHTVPIGEGWMDGSACDHLLFSKPYPFGPDLEWCSWVGGHARVLWVLPVTRAERDYKAQHGLEALEQRFDEAAIQYWDPARPSVV
jgi:hypothetical protein